MPCKSEDMMSTQAVPDWSRTYLSQNWVNPNSLLSLSLCLCLSLSLANTLKHHILIKGVNETLNLFLDPINIDTKYTRVSQKFCNILVSWGTIWKVLDAFAKTIKGTNHTGLWDVKLSWYSLSATHQICLHGLRHSLRFPDFRSTWHCKIIEVFVSCLKFLEPSSYCTLFNFTDKDKWNRHNVHKMFISIYRNPKTWNWFRYETFIHLFEFKGFSTWGEKERHNLSMLTAFTSSALNPTNARRP